MTAVSEPIATEPVPTRIEVVIGTLFCLGRDDEWGRASLLTCTDSMLVLTVEVVWDDDRRTCIAIGDSLPRLTARAHVAAEEWGVPVVERRDTRTMQ
jgi:hypothetical protein